MYLAAFGRLFHAPWYHWRNEIPQAANRVVGALGLGRCAVDRDVDTELSDVYRLEPRGEPVVRLVVRFTFRFQQTKRRSLLRTAPFRNSMLAFGDVGNRSHSRRLDPTTFHPPLSADRYDDGCRGSRAGGLGGEKVTRHILA